mmetsp:Transcript_8864/g.26316  ORF Transcript_8864/g.26316 Transcript_8864/m.26316 type:complete len:232 (+) Transcript_8864:687-1382(+)
MYPAGSLSRPHLFPHRRGMGLLGRIEIVRGVVRFFVQRGKRGNPTQRRPNEIDVRQNLKGKGFGVHLVQVLVVDVDVFVGRIAAITPAKAWVVPARERRVLHRQSNRGQDLQQLQGGARTVQHLRLQLYSPKSGSGSGDLVRNAREVGWGSPHDVGLVPVPADVGVFLEEPRRQGHHVQEIVQRRFLVPTGNGSSPVVVVLVAVDVRHHRAEIRDGLDLRFEGSDAIADEP